MTQAFNIVLPQPLVTQIDLTAKDEFKNRSEFIREAVIAYLRKKAEWDRIFTFGKKQAKKLGITNQKQIDDLVYRSRH